jgi:hypothetical protein
VALGSDNFTVAQVRAVVHGNWAAGVAPDIFVLPTTLVIINSSNVERFVSRLHTDEGLVNVTLRTTGAQGLPSEGIPIAASVDGVVLARNTSGADGFAHLLVKLRKPPGMSMCMPSRGQSAVAGSMDISNDCSDLRKECCESSHGAFTGTDYKIPQGWLGSLPGPGRAGNRCCTLAKWPKLTDASCNHTYISRVGVQKSNGNQQLGMLQKQMAISSWGCCCNC